VNAHSNEVDDLHISCDGKQVMLIFYNFMYVNTYIADVLLCLRCICY